MWPILFAFLAGSTLPLAFAPFNVFTFAYISPAVLLYIFLHSTPRQAFWRGLLFGFAFFTVGTSWVFISVNTYGNTPLLISALVTLLFILYLALYPAALGYALVKFFGKRSPIVISLCAFPALWVVSELLRAWVFTGFPWLLLGYSQLVSPLKSMAPLFGVYGLSLLCALIAGALAVVGQRNSYPIKLGCVILIFGSMAIGWMLDNKTWTKPYGEPIRVALIQGNVAQPLKWNPDYLIKTLDKYDAMTKPYWNRQLIVWPEAAVPGYPSQLVGFFNRLKKLTQQHNNYVLLGAPVSNIKTDKIYNALLLIGKNNGEYRKRHLVPFGEYVPLRFLFNWFINYFDVPLGELTPGEKQQPVLSVFNTKLATFICYEIAFPLEALSEIENKQLIVTLSDDSWFGRSIALAQHLQMTQFQSAATQRPGLVVTNTGITALIQSDGTITQQAPIDKVAVITGSTQPRSGPTPLMRWKYYPVWIVCLILLLLGAFRRHRPTTEQDPS